MQMNLKVKFEPEYLREIQELEAKLKSIENDIKNGIYERKHAQKMQALVAVSEELAQYQKEKRSIPEAQYDKEAQRLIEKKEVVRTDCFNYDKPAIEKELADLRKKQHYKDIADLRKAFPDQDFGSSKGYTEGGNSAPTRAISKTVTELKRERAFLESFIRISEASREIDSEQYTAIFQKLARVYNPMISNQRLMEGLNKHEKPRDTEH